MHMQLDIALGERLRSLFPRGQPNETAFRKMVAALNTKYDVGLPSWIFGYADDQTVLSDRFPSVSFGLNRDSLRLSAIGQDACEVLTQRGYLLQAALIRELQCPVQVVDRSGEHALSYSRMPLRYYMRRLVVGKTRVDSYWWRSASTNNGQWSENAKFRLAHLLGNALWEQACFLMDQGDELGGDIGEWLESMVGSEDPRTNWTLRSQFKLRLGIECVAVGDGHTAVRSTGTQGLRVMLRDVDFTAKADIQGLWWAGRGRIEGCGLLQRSRRTDIRRLALAGENTEADPS
ncbi:hypothetical protein ACFQNJ_16135 [Hydrogenophaga bisanensis]|uniref:CRISPR-associated protein Cas6 C-terminal domain-containing protein n=1 Tax=Hydrogenophaga bisanensis TaxID=439611 RepID=A0ABW2RDA4_9BURK